jgi:hypothetical protein
MNVLRKMKLFLMARGIYLSIRKPVKISELLQQIWPVRTEHELVRIGGATCNDGAYLLPDDLVGIDRVSSPGVASSVEFEKHFLAQGIPCELIDGSIDAAPESHDLITFQKKWLSTETLGDSISLTDWVQDRSLPNDELLLQMDIEGAEFECLLTTDRLILNRFRIIVLELHELTSALLQSNSRLFIILMRKLLMTHVVVHAHANNCCLPAKRGNLIWPNVLELTLLRRDRISHISGPADLPHALDRDNTNLASINLVWHS